MNLSLENMDDVIAAARTHDVFCAIEDVDRIQAALDATPGGFAIVVRQHPAVDPGTAIVIKRTPPPVFEATQNFFFSYVPPGGTA